MEPLEAFQTLGGGLVASGGDTLEMHDPGQRLIVDLQACRADTEGQIGVFVISGRKGRIEAAKLPEQLSADRQRRPGTVIDGTAIAVLRLVGIVQMADIPGRAIAKQHPARLLLTSVGIDEPTADQSRVRCLIESLQ